MAKEIEKKFLVNEVEWQSLKKAKGEFYRQGYILTDPKKTIRVRMTDTKSFLNIKGVSVGASRDEYEYEVPTDEAEELLNKFAETELTKIRYKINHHDKLWEVDVFLGDNTGLLIAEIELKSEDEPFDLPDWVGMEVTGDKRFYNSYLARNPFTNWSQ